MTTTCTITREYLDHEGNTIGEQDIDIEATYYPKTRANGYQDSAEIISAFICDDEVTLTDDEEERAIAEILRNPPHN